MNDLPIIFKGSMVRAIIELIKIYTRRTRKPNWKPGDTLWVRENTMFHPVNNWLYRHGMGRVMFCADMTDVQIKNHKFVGWKIKPSIHVPKAFSRVRLLVKDVRVEPLHAITEEEAMKEGAPIETVIKKSNNSTFGYRFPTYRDSFIHLWDSINGKKDGCAWKDNPNIWVTQFILLEVRNAKTH